MILPRSANKTIKNNAMPPPAVIPNFLNETFPGSKPHASAAMPMEKVAARYAACKRVGSGNLKIAIPLSATSPRPIATRDQPRIGGGRDDDRLLGLLGGVSSAALGESDLTL